MQIIRCLINVAYDHHQQSPSESQPIPTDVKVVSNDKALLNNRGDRQGRPSRSATSNKFRLFNLLPKKNIAKACSFYNTLSLNRLRSSKSRRQHSVEGMKIKKENPINNDHHVGNTKVLPVSDATSLTKDSGGEEKILEKAKISNSDHKKTITKMKELLRWAAVAKSSSDKGNTVKFLARKILQFRNRSMLKSVPDDDQLSNDSPKISFRWDVESCSTTSSVYSAHSMASSTNNDLSIVRKGNWIHTDSEFVVLEL